MASPGAQSTNGRDVQSLLRRVPLFATIRWEDIKRLAGFVSIQQVPAGTVILEESAEGDTFFIITAGKVKVTRLGGPSREIVLALLGGGDFFGEIALLDGKERTATVVSVEPTSLLLLRRTEFLRLLEQHPPIAVGIMRELVRRLRRIDDKVKHLSLSEAPGRVAGAIMELIEDRALPRMNNLRITELPPQRELARQAGVSRETISKVLGSLVGRGVVRREGHSLVICDFPRFSRFAL